MFLRHRGAFINTMYRLGQKTGGGSYTNIRGVWPSFSYLEPAVAFMPPLSHKTKNSKHCLLD